MQALNDYCMDPDKVDPDDFELVHKLMQAKDECLDKIITVNYKADEQEYARFISKILEDNMNARVGPEFLDGHDLTPIIKHKLGEFMWLRAIDTMEWILLCVMGKTDFDRTLDSHVPTLCKYYNSFIGEDNWGDNEHTFMTVLNKYDEIKSQGYGNFARLLEG
jgi:hypothetical protein